MKKDIEIILLGEENVGKTQIINQLISGNFDEVHHKIYSPKENNITIKIEEDNKIKPKDLLIYNFPSTKNLSSINDNFMRTCDIILLVYDMTNIESFIELCSWNNLIIEKDNLIKCVIANKKDLLEKRLISEEDGKKFANEIGALYYETNAKNNKEISQLFNKIVKKYSELDIKIPENSKLLKTEVQLFKRKQKDSNCCDENFGPILYNIKAVNYNKEKNEKIKEKKNNIENAEKDIMKLINGYKEEIFNENKKDSIFTFNNEIVFKGELEISEFVLGN